MTEPSVLASLGGLAIQDTKGQRITASQESRIQGGGTHSQDLPQSCHSKQVSLLSSDLADLCIPPPPPYTLTGTGEAPAGLGKLRQSSFPLPLSPPPYALMLCIENPLADTASARKWNSRLLPRLRVAAGLCLDNVRQAGCPSMGGAIYRKQLVPSGLGPLHMTVTAAPALKQTHHAGSGP